MWDAALAGRAARHGGFVESGGTSLGAARVAARLRRGLGRAVSAVDVLRAAGADMPSPGWSRDAASAPRWAVASTRGPLDPAANGLWFDDLSTRGRPVLETLLLDVPADVDEHRLVWRPNRAGRHPVFGAEVEDRDGVPCSSSTGTWCGSSTTT